MLLLSHLLLVMTTSSWLVSGQSGIPTVPCYGPDCSGQSEISTIPTVPCYGPDCSVTKSTTESTTDGSTSTTSTTPSTTTSSTTSTPTPQPGSVQRTVVFLLKSTQPGQDMFIRGGIDATVVRPICQGDQDAETSECAISIQVNSLGTGTPWAGYDAWRVGDTKLDWFGAQKGQGSYNNNPAYGTPMAWTTDNPAKPEYQPLNKWGDGNWMVDFDMDCSETENGWFDVKAYLTDFGSGWEADIVQSLCTGTGADVVPPYSGTKNHMARCGYINRFNFGSGGCEIYSF